MSVSGCIYVSSQHLLIITLSIYFLVLAPSLGVKDTLLASTTLLASIFILSLVQEKRAWAFSVEIIRLLASFTFAFTLDTRLWWQLIVTLLLIISLTFLWQLYRSNKSNNNELTTKNENG